MNEDTQICVSLFLSGEHVKIILLETDITKNLKNNNK